jgi:hypothetical protein
MPARLPVARWFLTGGGLLAALGLVLWLTLPIHAMFPPYLVTSALALVYGAICFWRGRVSDAGKS